MGKTYLKALLFAAAFGITAASVKTSAEETAILNGNDIQVQFQQSTGEVILYRYQKDGSPLQMSRPSQISYPVINQMPVSDFTDFTCQLEDKIEGTAGTGNRMTITSHSEGTGLTRICELETVDEVSGLLHIRTSYKADDSDLAIQSFTDCEFALENPAQTVWSYNGGGEGRQSYYDTLQKIDLTDNVTFQRNNKQDETSVGVPAADIYSENGGITVGDASITRRALQTPVEEKNQTVYTSIKRPSKTIKAQETVSVGEGFVTVHDSDYYMGLRGYADGMRQIGFETLSPDQIPDSSYDLRWESWGWEFNWTLELILGKLDELQELGIKQVTLDDGWYINAGEWNLNHEKLPNGDADMKRLTDEIHKRGMTALLWWRPCDGGLTDSKLYKEHPEYFVKNKDQSTGILAGPGSFNQVNGTTGYALCPSSKGAVQSQVDFVKKAIGEWGFDGLKSDYVWSLPNCYNADHHHKRPEESTEQQAVFYREVFKAMTECKKDAFHLLCNCGTPQDYYSLPYVTQIPTADPTSVDQTRRRVKAYKALCGDYFPVTTDHNEIWYPSAVGTGAVLIEKRNMTGSKQADYEHWLKIAQEVDLQRGEFVGNLYSYGFDPYETYVVNKDGTMYYAFYRDGTKYRPTGNPKIVLKGLNPNRLYRIVDYVNNQVLTTNVPGDEAEFDHTFSSYLLLRAEELSSQDSIKQEISVEETDPAITRTGAWNAETGNGFSGGGCIYTTSANAEISFTFKGNSIAWYGQKDTNFGTAQIYIDDEPPEEISCQGTAATGVKLYEKTGLSGGSHTIRIVCKTPVIDLDRFVYTKESEDSGSDTSVSSASQFTTSFEADDFLMGEGWEAFAAAKNQLDEILSDENADSETLEEAQEQFFQTLFELRKPVQRDLIGSPALLPPETETDSRNTDILYRTIVYAEHVDTQNLIPAVSALYQQALTNAQTIFKNPRSNQNEINQAWAKLLNQIQYAGYVKGDKTNLQKTYNECQKALSLYPNSQGLATVLQKAKLLLADENALEDEITEMTNNLLAEKEKLSKNEKKIPGQVQNVTAKSLKKSLQINWTPQPDAASYTVSIQKGSTWENAGTTTQCTLVIGNLQGCTKYQIKVTAANEKGTGTESAILYTATSPEKPKIKSVQNYKATGLKITCKKRGETGFEVWVKKGKKAFKKTASGSKAVKLKKGIRMSGKVSVKIRGYIKNNNTKIYGPFKKVKFKNQ